MRIGIRKMNIKIILVIIISIIILVVVLSNIIKNEKNDRVTKKSVIEYSEKILDDIYIDNTSLLVMGSGRFIDDIIEMHQPSMKVEGVYFYDIKNEKQLKITLYADGRIKGMYYNNKKRVSNKLYEKLRECKDIESVNEYIDDVYVFNKNTSILDKNQEDLEYPFCEICFDNYDTCKILLDKKGNIIDFIYNEYRG